MGMDFVAIDFETANEWRGSICAVGMAKVRDWKVVDSTGLHINPECEFGFWNTRIHGITQDHVICAPTWQEAWPEIREYIGNDALVCHNASFDMSVLKEALEGIGERIEQRSLCTLLLARSLWREMESYKLNELCKACGIPLVHHNAKSDAEACAMLAIELARSANLETIEQLLSFKIDAAVLAASGAKKSFDDNVVTSEPVLKSLTVAFTGGLASMSRSMAESIVSKLGGFAVGSVYNGVNILVVGEQVSAQHATSHSKKLNDAAELKRCGKTLAIVHEDEFLDIIKGISLPKSIKEVMEKREKAKNAVLRTEVKECLLAIADICKTYGMDKGIDLYPLGWRYSTTSVSVNYYYRFLDVLVQKRAVFLIIPNRFLKQQMLGTLEPAPKAFGDCSKLILRNLDDVRNQNTMIEAAFLEASKKYQEVKKYIKGDVFEYQSAFSEL